MACTATYIMRPGSSLLSSYAEYPELTDAPRVGQHVEGADGRLHAQIAGAGRATPVYGLRGTGTIHAACRPTADPPATEYSRIPSTTRRL